MKNGFTLLELSIVIVIIGLIAGGVLIGRDLIELAQLRRQISQFEEFNTAINSFRGKYNCIPGDCANAVKFDLGDDGDGSGVVGDWSDGLIIPSTSENTLYNQESINFWQHLANAQLIENNFSQTSTPYDVFQKPGINSPPLRLRGESSESGVGVNSAGGIWLANIFNINRNPEVFSQPYILATNIQTNFSKKDVYPAHIMFSIDSKTDDGLPFTGRMIVTSGWFTYTNPLVIIPITTQDPSGQFANACIDDGVDPAIYNIAGQNLASNPASPHLCTPIIKSILSN